jgi:hypothetical protein
VLRISDERMLAHWVDNVLLPYDKDCVVVMLGPRHRYVPGRFVLQSRHVNFDGVCFVVVDLSNVRMLDLPKR